MTKDKAQKRATRTRMAKTGESYTAARRHAVKPKEELSEELLGQSDESIRKNTGKGWKEWFRILDDWGAKEHKHGEIAQYVYDHGVSGWWSQTVTVGYERSRGMRAKHQSVAGDFQVSVSKTMPVAVGKLFKAFTVAPQRNKWLDKGTLKARVTHKNRTARFDFRGESRVQAYFEAKDRRKTTVTIQHEKLTSGEQVEEMRTFWKDHLGHLAKLLKD